MHPTCTRVVPYGFRLGRSHREESGTSIRPYPLRSFPTCAGGSGFIYGELPRWYKTFLVPPALVSLLSQSSLTPDLDPNVILLSQGYFQMAQDLQLFLSLSCRCFRPEEVTLIGERPIDAGGFADIYEATHGGCRVVLKSYRCYALFDIAQVAAVRYNRSLCWVYY